MLSGQSMQAGRWCGDACIRSSGLKIKRVNPSGLIMISRFPGGCWQYSKRWRADSTSGDVQAILFYFLLVLLFAYAVVWVVKVCILVKRSGWIQAENTSGYFPGCPGPFFECKRIGYLLLVCMLCRVSRSSGLSALTVWQRKRKRSSWIYWLYIFNSSLMLWQSSGLEVKRIFTDADIL